MSLRDGSKYLIALLHESWSSFEELIHSVSSIEGFSEFCRAYRGSVVAGSSQVSVLIREQNVQNVVRFFQQLLEKFSSRGVLAEEHLSLLEKSVNTALYYAYFDGDRNFQFRTFLHFLQIDSFDFSIQVANETVRIHVNELGFSFKIENPFSKFPERFSVATVLGLSEADFSSELSDENYASTFARVRAVQREFFLLIDEWEHLNSILAVEQFELRKLQSTEPEEASEKLKSIAARRDGLAQWCIESTADFQSFLSRLRSVENLTGDLRAEVDALDALILSGVQKYLLPASVSRHVYSHQVLAELLRWVRARKEHDPDDLYLHFADVTFSLALGFQIHDFKIPSLLTGRSSDWVLSAEPSAVIKAASWGLSPKEHHCLTLAYIVALDCKTAPQPLDSYWLHTIASVIEMPGTFSCPQKGESASEQVSRLPEVLVERALNAVENALHNDEEELQQTKRYIKEFLNVEA